MRCSVLQTVPVDAEHFVICLTCSALAALMLLQIAKLVENHMKKPHCATICIAYIITFTWLGRAELQRICKI